jgi:hypothetical protein
MFLNVVEQRVDLLAEMFDIFVKITAGRKLSGVGKLQNGTH